MVLLLCRVRSSISLIGMDQQQLIDGIKANAQEEFKATITAHEGAKRDMQARLDAALADLAAASKIADEAKAKCIAQINRCITLTDNRLDQVQAQNSQTEAALKEKTEQVIRRAVDSLTSLMMLGS